MKPHHIILLFSSLVLFSACHNKYEPITGYWEATFTDSVNFPKQILYFNAENGKLKLTIDEPEDGLLHVPGEHVWFQNDSLHYETVSGIYKYDGKLNPDNGVIKGIRFAGTFYSSPFIIRRISAEALSYYKIPRLKANGDREFSYTYRPPIHAEDGIATGTLAEADIDTSYLVQLVKNILSGKMATVHSLLLVKDNKLVFEEYFHNYNIHDVHKVESVIKTIQSALVGIAIDNGFIPDENEYVSSYFSDRDSTRWIRKNYPVQIRHLLSMTSGLEWKPYNEDGPSDDSEIYLSPDYINYVLNKNLINKPGKTFLYNNRFNFLHQGIIEKTSGMSLDSFAKTFLFSPLGTDEYEWKIIENGNFKFLDALKLSPRTMIKFGMLYLNKGKWNNQQIISPEWVSVSTEKHANAGTLDYGYTWWMKNYTVDGRSFRTIFALGHGEQIIMLIPEANAVFVMTGGNFMLKPQRQDEILTRYILPSLNTKNTTTPVIDLDKLAGSFETNSHEFLTIELRDCVLQVTDPAGRQFSLLPKSGNVYQVENSPLTVTFYLDDSGSLITAYIYNNTQIVDRLIKKEVNKR
ncbi:serine hydrolase domain-containing protein [Saccharicrinis sp. FJH62]|uniref:serine hydrolase domain-containing protein n=1 Tax=Saccharicrinis sp. FJH62 TaxID=3344657 RepID=UPI0035D51EF9